MQKLPSEVLASCVKASDAEAINLARKACTAVLEEVKYLETANAGRIAAMADVAERALFELLNCASSFGCCAEADRALKEYRDSWGV